MLAHVVKNTEQMKTRQQLAKEVILIQDACNPSGVVHFLVEVFMLLSEENADTKARCEDPIVRMAVAKLDDLCGGGGTDVYAQAYQACKEIAIGRKGSPPPPYGKIRV